MSNQRAGKFKPASMRGDDTLTDAWYNQEDDTTSYWITVKFEDGVGFPHERKFFNKSIPAAIWACKKEFGRLIKVIQTTTSMVTREDKCIPAPPPGWKYTMFKVNMKKNRFGKFKHGKAQVIE